MRFPIVFSIFFILAGFMPVYSADPQSSKADFISDQLLLQSRFEDFISARKSRNTESLYEMMSSDYRKTHTIEQFRSVSLGATIGLLAYYVDGIQIVDNQGTIHLVEYAIPSSIPAPRLFGRLVQSWIKESGTWYYEYEDPVTKVLPCGSDEVFIPPKTGKKPFCGGSNQGSSPNSETSKPGNCGS